ncbi:MAG: biotin transporter BioY [Moraxella sp.]|uniref:biotin transporter BioY n=1 Tax=Moraxella sp. TaxID=479 RepID=UPI0026DB22FF|nr:biotin transporter BioY [Moraxella sp.]MDO4450831.1 biotin transporter BioY [Moraxella sp.]
MYNALAMGKAWAAKNPAITAFLQIVIGANLVALMAQISIPTPFVAITGQSLAVLLVGFALGYKKAGMAMMLYLVEGAMGLPVFAMGRAGLPVLLGPSGGYLFGFVLMAMILGFASDKGVLKSSPKSVLVAVFATTVMYVCGLVQLSLFVPSDKVLAFGLYPFIVGDLIKAYLACVLMKPALNFFEKL